MEVYQMDFCSVTQAQRAARMLNQAGISAQVRRTSGRGNCGFSVAVPATARALAEQVVRGLPCRSGKEGVP